jgi:carboxymethylenebutenolidase
MKTEIHSQYVDLAVPDGTSMRAWFCAPAAGKAKAGLMIFQEAFGVNAHIRDVTERFARLGYAAAAPELYHRTAAGIEGSYDNFAAMGPAFNAINNTDLGQDVRATFEFLQQQASKVACVGYCLGGRVSFIANTAVPVKAAVSYYGGGIPAILDRASHSAAPMLFFWGEKDKRLNAEYRQKVADGMHASPQSSTQVTFSDADHGFFCDQRASYNPHAAELSWTLTLAFLDQQLAGGR